ncbi:hypothetical protein IEQ34_017842 [Dendrobium chrysotoxum]|uniref:Uncharacterized protein n=1 Tax=Dendrobium chrysotoxum TaxID=161865 RepID=A0AAV7GCM4_DENCH|nr:hypothetical protein IEQ34_017842 [Dendrobium chrysotoxum]
MAMRKPNSSWAAPAYMPWARPTGCDFGSGPSVRRSSIMVITPKSERGWPPAAEEAVVVEERRKRRRKGRRKRRGAIEIRGRSGKRGFKVSNTGLPAGYKETRLMLLSDSSQFV